ALDVGTGHSGRHRRVALDGLGEGAQALGDVVVALGDDRGHPRRGAVVGQGAGHLGDVIDGEVGRVEVDPAEPVDLQVDQTGADPGQVRGRVEQLEILHHAGACGHPHAPAGEDVAALV